MRFTSMMTSTTFILVTATVERSPMVSQLSIRVINLSVRRALSVLSVFTFALGRGRWRLNPNSNSKCGPNWLLLPRGGDSMSP